MSASDSARLDRGGQDGTVYFIEGEESRRVKIGYTAGRPEDRLKQLQTGNSERLRLVAILPGSPLLERQMHDRFSEERLTGEWFRRSPMMTGFLAGLEVSRTQWKAWREGKAATDDRARREAAERAAEARRKREEEAAEEERIRNDPVYQEEIRQAKERLLAAVSGIRSCDPLAVMAPVRRRAS